MSVKYTVNTQDNNSAAVCWEAAGCWVVWLPVGRTCCGVRWRWLSSSTFCQMAGGWRFHKRCRRDGLQCRLPCGSSGFCKRNRWWVKRPWWSEILSAVGSMQFTYCTQWDSWSGWSLLSPFSEIVSFIYSFSILLIHYGSWESSTGWGERRSTPWTDCQSIAGLTQKDSQPMGNL